jgi:hypothetical protein
MGRKNIVVIMQKVKSMVVGLSGMNRVMKLSMVSIKMVKSGKVGSGTRVI